MKTLPLYLLIIAILACSLTLKANDENVYSSKGYPYKQLLARAITVKIIFTEDEQQVRCKVEVNLADERITTEQRNVTKTDFEQQPLASCLLRDKAKTLLAKTFNYL